MRICLIKKCDTQHHARGYCQKHYQRRRKTSNPLTRTVYDPNKIITKGQYAYIELYDKNCGVIAYAKIDREYVEEVSQYKWGLNAKGYVKNKSTGYLHHLIYGKPPKGYEIDHKNGNKLDNTELNLRKSTRSQNNFNKPIQKNNTSGYTGVGKYGDRWKAWITYNGKHEELGIFDNIEDAIKARKKAEKDIEKFGFIKNNKQSTSRVKYL